MEGIEEPGCHEEIMEVGWYGGICGGDGKQMGWVEMIQIPHPSEKRSISMKR
jgi:hypothetical protein